MTPEKKLMQRLRTAEQKLRQVRQDLIRCEGPELRIVPALHQIAETLKAVESERDLIGGSEKCRQLLKDIQAGAARVELLLESAARLTCNSTLERPLVEGSYTPDGHLSPLHFSGRMVVHA